MTGSVGSPTAQAPPVPPPRPAVERSAPTAGLGLQPLPSPQQVTQAVQQGRVDPFSDPRPPAPAAAPLALGTAPASGASAKAGAAGSSPAKVVPAVPGLQLSGVIQSSGRPEAIVVMGSQSDSLRIGQQGSNDKDSLLPRGWSVESININACSLVLKNGGLLHSYKCANS